MSAGGGSVGGFQGEFMPLLKYDGSVAAETAQPATQFFGTDGVESYAGTAAAEGFWGGPADVMAGGAGDDSYWLKTGRDQVVELAGAGVDKITAWHSVTLADQPHVENVSVAGDRLYVAGNALDNTITGGAGADTFHSFEGAGLDRILDFNGAEGDRLQLLAGTTWTVSQVGADTVVTLGGGQDQVLLVGVQATSLSAGWIFAG